MSKDFLGRKDPNTIATDSAHMTPSSSNLLPNPSAAEVILKKCDMTCAEVNKAWVDDGSVGDADTFRDGAIWQHSKLMPIILELLEHTKALEKIVASGTGYDLSWSVDCEEADHWKLALRTARTSLAATQAALNKIGAE
jgi:hypothetical protein